MTTELKPGNCVSIENLSDKKWSHLNGKPGVVKRKLENGLYRVMVNSKNDFQVKLENLSVVKQCPNKRQRPWYDSPDKPDGYISHFLSILMWPDISRSEYPSLQWVESQKLNQILEEYLVSMGSNVSNGFTQNKKKRIEDCGRLSECLESLFGWKNAAQLRLDTVERNCDQNWDYMCEMYIVYDVDSTAKKNKHIETFFKNNNCSITRAVDLTGSQRNMSYSTYPLPQQLMEEESDVRKPLPEIRGPILQFCRYVGERHYRSAFGTSLNTFSIRFKTSFNSNKDDLPSIPKQNQLAGREHALDFFQFMERKINLRDRVCTDSCNDCKLFSEQIEELRIQEFNKELKRRWFELENNLSTIDPNVRMVSKLNQEGKNERMEKIIKTNEFLKKMERLVETFQIN